MGAGGRGFESRYPDKRESYIGMTLFRNFSSIILRCHTGELFEYPVEVVRSVESYFVSDFLYAFLAVGKKFDGSGNALLVQITVEVNAGVMQQAAEVPDGKAESFGYLFDFQILMGMLYQVFQYRSDTFVVWNYLSSKMIYGRMIPKAFIGIFI